jgi:purine nucleosidase
MRLAIRSLLAVLILAVPEAAAAKIPIFIDTDIGTDIDDAFALGLAIASPEVEIVGITTVGGGAEDRAWLTCRFLTEVGHKPVPVAHGRGSQPDTQLDEQIQYRRQFDARAKNAHKPVTDTAVELMAKKIREHDGRLTLVCLGPLTNVAALFREHPELKAKIQRIVLMAGSVAVGYDGKPTPEPEWNIKLDSPAAKSVFTSGVPLLVVPLDATVSVKLGRDAEKRLFAEPTPLTSQVQTLYRLFKKTEPTLYDPVAVTAVFEERFLTVKELSLEVDDKGMSLVRDGKPNARVAVGVKADDFLKWYVERVPKWKLASSEKK